MWLPGAVGGGPYDDAEIVAVDWSGARDPRGRIWLAVARGGRLHELFPATSREAAVDAIVERGRAATGPLAVGLDFAFSLPAWFLHERGLASAPDLWRLVASDGERWLAECAPPFWGRPGRARPACEAHFRRTELDCEPVAGIRPKSVFQIGGAGAVGTGSLRGMPHLLRLAEAGFAVWPFDATSDRTVFELYPRLCTGPVRKSDPVARAGAVLGWMARGELDDELALLAASCEDAFDAAASALVVSAQRSVFADLPRARDDTERLEGRILPVTPPREAEVKRRGGSSWSTRGRDGPRR
jgi:hypothetical protein